MAQEVEYDQVCSRYFWIDPMEFMNTPNVMLPAMFILDSGFCDLSDMFSPFFLYKLTFQTSAMFSFLIYTMSLSFTYTE